MKLVCLLFLLISCHAFAQQKQIENIVFEGAGISIAYAGAIKELEQKSLLKNVSG
jgi:hypothetical protein